MVIDAANGVETQTRRLIEVCRQRDTPIITFVNKMDREGRDPLELLDEVEQELGMPCVPMTWPVGQGKAFGGIVNLRKQSMRLFDGGADKRGESDETVPLSNRDKLHGRFGHDWELAEQNMALMAEAGSIRSGPSTVRTPVQTYGVPPVFLSCCSRSCCVSER